MRLADIINRIKEEANAQPTINMVVDNDVFRLNSEPSAKYGVFAYTQGQHRESENYIAYTFTFFYVDRLTESGSNELEIQSVGISTLSNIMRGLSEDFELPGSWTYQTFRQRFADMCAGVFCNVTLTAPVQYVCADKNL